jgi:hypothetical protein
VFALSAPLQLTSHSDIKNLSFEVFVTNPQKWKTQSEWFPGKTYPASSMEDADGLLGYTWQFSYSVPEPIC